MGRRVTVSPAFVALLCTMLFLDEEGLVLPFLLAAALHETGHLLVLHGFGIHPEAIRIGLCGAVIPAAFPSYRAELLTVLAGPAVNLALVLGFFRLWPSFFAANAVLLLYNLLPIYPLDGGRLLFLGLRCFLPEQAAAVVQVVGNVCIVGIVILCAVASISAVCGLFPWLLAVSFLFRLKNLLAKPSLP